MQKRSAEGRPEAPRDEGAAAAPSPPLVEILEVVQAEPSQEIWGHLDEPRGPGGGSTDTNDTYSFELSGWALGRRRPVTAVELVTRDDTSLWRIVPQLERPDVAATHPGVAGSEQSGFYAPVSALAMPADFELRARAVLDDDTRVELATVRGRRSPLRPAPEPSLKPLLITTVGRTGSTAFFDLLHRHPQILAYRPFLYETRVATYWVDVLRSLSEPSSYLRQLAPDGNLGDRTWWLGMRAPVRRRVIDREIQEWMGVKGVDALAAFCQSRIEALYEEIAQHFGRDDVVYFAERYVPTVAPYLMWEMYPNARELVLVRDFRDMVSSIMAFDAKRGFYGFDRPAGESDEDYVRRLGERVTMRLLGSWSRRKDVAHLVRYEDLVRQPDETIDRILAYLGLDRDASIVEQMRVSLWERSSETERHRTTADPEASIGRWERDLTPSIQRVVEEAFGPALEAFGYKG